MNPLAAERAITSLWTKLSSSMPLENLLIGLFAAVLLSCIMVFCLNVLALARNEEVILVALREYVESIQENK